MGSTTPDSTPPAKARSFPSPSARRGMETMAPSGKFWTAMPRESASTPIAVISVSPARYPAQTTPTAIPSGMLWSVTASTIMVVRCSWLFGPSTCGGRCKGPLSQLLRPLNSRDQQAPNRRRRHHPCREARQPLLQAVRHRLFHKEHARRAQGGAQEREQESV